jgi:aryl-alcohol dehydrogenase-like predicted oxidoreductase
MTNMIWAKYMNPKVKDETCKKMVALAEVAKELGFTQAQLALAWVVANGDVSTAILGFSRIEQVAENLKAVELLKVWTPEIEKRVNEILDNSPAVDMDFRQWAPMPTRREQTVCKK